MSLRFEENSKILWFFLSNDEKVDGAATPGKKYFETTSKNSCWDHCGYSRYWLSQGKQQQCIGGKVRVACWPWLIIWPPTLTIWYSSNWNGWDLWLHHCWEMDSEWPFLKSLFKPCPKISHCIDSVVLVVQTNCSDTVILGWVREKVDAIWNFAINHRFPIGSATRRLSCRNTSNALSNL